MPQRKQVTVDELIDFINAELEARGHDVRVKGPIYALREPDEGESNIPGPEDLIWRLGDSEETPKRAMGEVVAEARRRFNLREDE